MPKTCRLLFKRNVQIELTLWRRILFEVITVVILLILILVNPISYTRKFLYSHSDPNSNQAIASHKLEDIKILTNLVDSKREQTKYILSFAPISVFTQEVSTAVSDTLELKLTDGFDDPMELQTKFDERTVLAGVVYRQLDDDETIAPNILDVSIRFPSEFRTVNPFLTEDRLWLTRCSGVVSGKRDGARDADMNQDMYIREGFLQLQHQIFIEWFQKLRNQYPPNNAVVYNVEVFNIRLHLSEENCNAVAGNTIPGFLFYFLYLLPFVNIIRNIAGQLRDNVMTHQWYYGYSFWKQYLNIFLVLMIRLLILGLFILLFIFIYWTADNAKFSLTVLILFFFFILIFTMELIITALVISKIFKNETNGVLFGISFWLLNYAVFSIILKRYWDNTGHYVLFILSTFFCNQFPFAMQVFHRLIVDPDTIKTYDVIALFCCAVACAIIYFLIFLLLQWRLPGRLISRRILFKKKPKEMEGDNRVMYLGRMPSWQNFEFGDVGSEEYLRVRHVYTSHRISERKILKNISMHIYKGEIFVVLGHIGSGKLTLMRIICGLKYPLRGSVKVMDKNMYEDMEKCRKFVDFRSYENGLAEHLTLEQTINYHVLLKMEEVTAQRYEAERTKWIDMLEAYIGNRKTLIGNFTYGERRLIALCCAMACETKVICLEEPTRKLKSREAHIFWNIISFEKEKRAFVIFTYSIDETDAIADRIGILNLGVLEASGTPFFLRHKFSSSVELILIKKPHVPDAPITDFISQYLKNVEPENEIGDTLTYKISSEHRTRLQKMLIHLENERKKLGIENIRVVGAEMSDIYMKLATSFRLQEQVIPDVTQSFKYSVVSKKKLRRQQIRAMFYKKMITNAPSVWPVLMIFSCCILIVIITRLAVVLDVPHERSNSIALGFKDLAGTRDLPDITECGYIDIKSLDRKPVYDSSNELKLTFEPESFKCEPGKYKDDLKAKKITHSLGAVEYDGDLEISGFISQDTFHSAPMMLNMLHNIMIQLTYGKESDYAALVEGHPMPTPLSMKIGLLDNEIAHINAPLAIGCVLPLTVSVFIIPLVEEHISHLRILQIIAGLGLQIYWGVNLFWDLFTYFIYSIIIVIIVGCTNVGGFGWYENLLLLLLIIIFGLAALPITYVISMYVNKSVVRAFLASVLFHSITGLVMYIIYWDVANNNVVFFYGSCVLPGFSLLEGISNIYIRCLEEQLCRDRCSAIENCTPKNMHEFVPHCNFKSHFQWENPGVLPSITFMLLAALFALLLIFWIELHRKEKKFHSSRDMHKMSTATYQFDDSDVADVKQKIAQADMSKCKQSVFLVDQVESKIPANGNKINTISFALNKYMSMGIFGPRNSGKSHLIRQLVGVDGFAFGEIYVRGLDFKYDLDTILGYVGYCPQSKGYLSDLTPREHIRLLCMIRGVAEQKINEKMHDLCLMLNMTGWMHRKCDTLTPEKCRKLNVALALVAYNKIFILDEPTCGMPSTTRREIWNILRYLRYCGKTIIFTSNDELECKVLADFIILFENSEMLAIGSMQYLRYKYSHGFYLEVRLIRDGGTLTESENNLRKDVENLSRFINFLHDKSELVARLHNWFKYYIPVGHIVYSYLYGAMEKNKVRLNIFDYCIYQASMNVVVAQVQETRSELKRRIAASANANRPTSHV